ncbi:MAG: DUF5995 family protein [Actinomycetota bacterium]|nr:DUF5995 family protein [Actinomycetota bacterium]
MDGAGSGARRHIDAESARALQVDSQCVLGELCAAVDDGLAELAGPAVLSLSSAGSEAADLLAGLRACATAVVGAADFIAERTGDIVATLPPATAAGLDGVDGSTLIERGLATLQRMRGEPGSPGTGARLASATGTSTADGWPPGETSYPVAKLPRLKRARTIDDVAATFDEIIDWSIEFGHGLGYFATVYKRATLAIRDKVHAGDYFDDNARMVRFDTVFAQRYFDALNAYFHPADYEAPTHVWQWCFDGHEYDEPIILQHMLTAVNSHVNLDLGIAAAMVGAGDMAALEADFNRINTLLADEVAIFLDTVAELSPRVKLIRRILPCEDPVLNHVLRIFRDLAWAFANQLDVHQRRRRAYIGIHDAWAAVLGSYYLHTSDTINRLVEWIAETESRDVAHNIRVLDGRGN